MKYEERQITRRILLYSETKRQMYGMSSRNLAVKDKQCKERRSKKQTDDCVLQARHGDIQ